MANLDCFFSPKSIAVVGASNNPRKPGCIIVGNLLQKGFPGEIYPVNPKEAAVLGKAAFPTLSEIPGEVELVVLITPAAMIYGVMADLALRMERRGDIKALVCAAADYGETKTAEGVRRQSCLLETASKFGIRVLGPNCIGVIDNRTRVDTTFVDAGIPADAYNTQSGISVISQSGSVATSIIMMGAARPEPVQFNKFASLGNMTDVDFIDLLEHYEQDKTTSVIGVYMEGYPDGRRLIETMGRIARKKPIVVLKVGRGQKGAKAASSHTGSLAGSDATYDAAFRQYGVIRTDTFGELIDTMISLDRLALPRGGNLYILSQAGGFGIYCADNVEKYPFIRMPKLARATADTLAGLLPPMAVVDEPEGYADITASASEEQHAQSLAAILRDDGVDCVILITITPSFISQKKLGESLRDAYLALPEEYRKPVYFCIMAGEYVRESRRILEQAGLCTYDTPLEAVRSARDMMRYAGYLAAKEESL